MTNLVEILSGKHENVTLIMNDSERKKIARMRDFLCAKEKEIYEQIDHYDIANMKDAELDGLLDLSFDTQKITLPDEVEDLLADLRRDVGKEEHSSHEGGGSGGLIGKYAGFGIAASVFAAVFFATHTFISSDEMSFADNSDALVAQVDAGSSIVLSDNAMPNPSQTPFAFPDVSTDASQLERLVAADPIKDLLVSDLPLDAPSPSFAGYPLSVSTAPAGIRGSVGPEDSTSAPDQLALLPNSLASVSTQRPSPFMAEVGNEEQSFSNVFEPSSHQSTEHIINSIQHVLGSGTLTRAVVDGDSENVIFQFGGMEIHVFNLILSEGESVYTIARETDLDPNIYNLIEVALEGDSRIDTTTMVLDDRVFGVAARSGDQYSLSELVYDRVRASDAVLIHSSCTGQNSASEGRAVGFDSWVCGLADLGIRNEEL